MGYGNTVSCIIYSKSIMKGECVMDIEWKTVPNTNGRYKANVDGVIFDNKLNRKVPYSKHKRGWLRCHLWVDGVRKTIGVNRVIMFTFCGHSNLTVNHIDGNKENNSLSNLEYLTIKENNIHRSSVLKSGNRKKVKCLETGKIYETVLEASQDIGGDAGHISSVCKGKYGFKSVKGYTFNYVEDYIMQDLEDIEKVNHD